MIIREPYRRNLKYPGLSISIVIDANTGERIMPVEEIRSRTGAHGEDIYDIVTPVYILRYRRSNSGKAIWDIAYVKPSEGRVFKKVWFKDLKPKIREAIERECEKEGIELHVWEEDKHESVIET